MAGTRTKQTIGDFNVDRAQMTRQEAWCLNPTACMHERPAFPLGLNAPHMPASMLSNNSVDLESMLRGIGANNYIYTKPVVTPKLVHLPPVCFYETAPLYIPVLPPRLTGQRPF